MAELTKAERDDDPRRPYIRSFVAEAGPDAPPRLMAVVPCGYCGGVHTVPFGDARRTKFRMGLKPPRAPCDPSKLWVPAVSFRPGALESYAKARAEVKAATAEAMEDGRLGARAGRRSHSRGRRR